MASYEEDNRPKAEVNRLLETMGKIEQRVIRAFPTGATYVYLEQGIGVIIEERDKFKAEAEQCHQDWDGAASRVRALLEELQTLRKAVRPFAALVETTSGRIPTERLSLADWHNLAKAMKGESK